MITKLAQFLNVMNGGSLWQDVNNHGKDHNILTNNGETFVVTSTHHQMMRPSNKGIVLAVSTESTYKKNIYGTFSESIDVEVVYYPENNTLCVQSHPEFQVSNPKEDVRFLNWFNTLITNLP